MSLLIDVLVRSCLQAALAWPQSAPGIPCDRPPDRLRGAGWRAQLLEVFFEQFFFFFFFFVGGVRGEGQYCYDRHPAPLYIYIYKMQYTTRIFNVRLAYQLCMRSRQGKVMRDFYHPQYHIGFL